MNYPGWSEKESSMKIVVPLKLVPDLVEDLEVDGSGTQLDYEYLKIRLNEFDEHALEEALLIKESSSAEVIALAIDDEEVDKILYTAIAKGADKAVKITGIDWKEDNHVLGSVLADAIRGMGADLVLTGVQSAGDRDGQLGPILAVHLGCPCISVVTAVKLSGSTVIVEKEYSGGMAAEFEVDLPVVLGIQAARQTPRYAPVSKVRQVQQATTLETLPSSAASLTAVSKVLKMAPPEKTGGAQMLTSATEIVAIMKEKGVL